MKQEKPMEKKGLNGGAIPGTIVKWNLLTVIRASPATYFTDGCASSAISGFFAVELAIGKDPDELTDISGVTVLEEIGRLPAADRHCADLAAATLQEALGNYITRNQND